MSYFSKYRKSLDPFHFHSDYYNAEFVKLAILSGEKTYAQLGDVHIYGITITISVDFALNYPSITILYKF